MTYLGLLSTNPGQAEALWWLMYTLIEICNGAINSIGYDDVEEVQCGIND